MTQMQECREHDSLAVTPIARLQKICDKPICISDLKITVLNISQIQPGSDWNCQKHSHEFFEYMLVTEGSITTSLNGTEMTTQAGQYFVIAPRVVHCNRLTEPDKPVTFIIVRWRMEKIPLADQVYIPLADSLLDTLSGIYTDPVAMSAHDRILTTSKEYPASQLQCLILGWILGIGNAYSKKSSRPPAPHRTNIQDKGALVRNVLMTMRIMYSRNVDVSQIAKDNGISYSRLSRIFKEVTGRTLVEHLTSIRIEHAKEMLRDTTMSIKEIAALTGFSDPYYFSKVYKRAVGMSPGKSRAVLQDLG